ncbi:DegT/DnrJ/EryC1/StrS family aminotransferase [Nitratireductor mangrovi]|uniref:DegT/DnrJ/EryC1/StrS family aminotransferase n=1 Tax=Nitratireductor mangrovi TaxID=2599600 RepID=A0A5B8KYH4_9HYPH|nr:DegT/DnrJ/EryC1/StrS family aminotransferase [Nitratireductor mangrovi]QDZ00530.1 DegT/DnrJ/EryC1/StrS family aminotransferase [Nitratireductor mangrovi]
MQFVDLASQRERIKKPLEAAIAKVIAEGRYIHGPEVAEFEKALADYVGVEHVVACANGTDALLVPLMALGIGPGDAVFCPSFTFAATAEVVVLAGAEPVFVDIDPVSYNMSPQSLEAAIDHVNRAGLLNPKAIIPVDLFGLSADYGALQAIAERAGLTIIEDAAQSIGGQFANHRCGAFGDVAGTSFYPAKPLGCYGDGGAMLTNDAALAEILRSIAFHGKGKSQYDNVRIGLNSRLDTLQAAILIQKLTILPDEMDRRQAVAERYNALLGDVVKTPVVPSGFRSAWAQYTIKSDRRDDIRTHLTASGIPSMVYYEKPLHLQPAYDSFERSPTGLAASEAASRSVLCLPMHPYLGEADQSRIAGAVREAVAARDTPVAAAVP